MSRKPSSNNRKSIQMNRKTPSDTMYDQLQLYVVRFMRLPGKQDLTVFK